MRTVIRIVTFALLGAFACAFAYGDCAALAKLSVPHAAITRAEVIAGGVFSPGGEAPLDKLPPFCRVAATLKPTPASDIRIEVWLPESGWNGRMEGTGNGGFAGKISYGSLAGGLRAGYAVTNTDMGMATPPGFDASVFAGQPERWADWGYRATHEMTVAAKQVVTSYYGREPRRAYFSGCSTGGEQALMEAERFPADYDGIVAGAPANNRTGVHVSILWNFMATRETAASYIPAAKLMSLNKAVVAACGAQDGLIADPRQCLFDPSTLLCKGPDSDACLTQAQVRTVKRLYAGPVDPRTGTQLYPGLPRGSEFGWEHLGAAPGPAAIPPYAPIFRWVFGQSWDWHTFDFGRANDVFEHKLAATLNATSPNLDAFHARGGKLVVYHGWADWLVVPGESLKYHAAVRARYKDAGDFYRLFLVPGMAHCGGGPGPDHLDTLDAVTEWVEKGEAPKEMVARKVVDGKSSRISIVVQEITRSY